jgi:hypothetical protein
MMRQKRMPVVVFLIGSLLLVAGVVSLISNGYQADAQGTTNNFQPSLWILFGLGLITTLAGLILWLANRTKQRP